MIMLTRNRWVRGDQEFEAYLEEERQKAYQQARSELDLFVIDPLSYLTEEQRDEIESRARKARRRARRVLAEIWGTCLLAGMFVSIGTVLGNHLDADVTDLWVAVLAYILQ